MNMQKSAFLRGSVMSVTIQAQFIALQLITIIVLSRTLGAEEFGVYSLALSVITLLQVIPHFGLENVTLRNSVHYLNTKNYSSLIALWKFSLVFSIAYGLVCSAIMYLAYLFFFKENSGPIGWSLVLASMLTITILPILSFVTSTIRSTDKGLLGQLPNFVIKPWCFFALLISSILVFETSLSASYAMVFFGISVMIALIYGTPILTKHSPTNLTTYTPDYRTKEWLQSIIPFSLLGGLMLLNAQADILMLGMLSDAREAGIYKVASSGANLVSIPLIAANLFIASRVTSLYTRNKKNELQSVLSMSAIVTSSVSLLSVVIFFICGERLIDTAFGEEYSEAFHPLAILSLGHLISVAFGSNGTVLAMTGHEKDAALLAFAAAVVNVALNGILIPKFGTQGAAIATAISSCIWNTLMWLRVRSKIKVNTSIFKKF